MLPSTPRAIALTGRLGVTPDYTVRTPSSERPSSAARLDPTRVPVIHPANFDALFLSNP
jgi:hypothetical protein